MSNLPKFLLCENPIADQSDGRQFILHARRPFILAEVFHTGPDNDYPEEKAMEIKRAFDVGFSLDYSPYEYIIGGAVWIEPGLSEEELKSLPKLMRRMADWYEAYLQWEDSQDYSFEDEDE